MTADVAAVLREPDTPGSVDLLGGTGTPHPRRRPGSLHPDSAASRGIAKGDWVQITTPEGSVRARAAFNRTLDPGVVCGQHGWYEACGELDLPGHPPFGPGSANLNLVLSQTPSDPISGSSPLRAQVCQVSLLDSGA